MKKYIFIFVILLIIMSNNSYGESLFNPGSTRTTSLFADPSSRASQVGDIICIVINPETKIDTTNTYKMKKDMAYQADFLPINILGGPFTPLDIGGDGSSGTTETGKKDFTFTTTISAIIQEVLPNGNFVVMGTQEVLVGDKIQSIQFSGVVRPGDITLNNTIVSSKIANVMVNIQGELGEIEEKRGILTRFLDLLF